MKHYSPGSKPEFIEGTLFKTIIPTKVGVAVADTAIVSDKVDVEVEDVLNNAINEVFTGGISEGITGGINKGIIEGISKLIKIRLVSMTVFLIQKEKLKTSDFVIEFKLSSRTIKNNLNTLKLLNIIVYSGSAKTGYYEINREFLKKLKRKAKLSAL